MNEVLNQLLIEFQDLETVGVIFGLISVGLTVKENLWCWPFGIINVLLFAIIFYKTEIFGQMVLQFFFLALILFGWYSWTKKGVDNTTLTPKRISKIQLIYSATITLLIVYFLEFSINFFSTNKNLSLLDSIITSLSFTAQFFLAKKILENWIIWIVVDVLSIYLFIQTELYKVSFFYFLLLILATSGYFTWKRKLEN